MKDNIPLLACVRQTNGTVTRLVNSYDLAIFDACKKYPVFPLYTLHGLAPTYFSDHLGGKFANVKMHWTRGRTHPLQLNYNEVFGGKEYTTRNVQAVNQLFLKEEAEIFKTWIDGIYPEENTQIYEISYPLDTDIDYVPAGWAIKETGGAFICFDYRWRWDWIITYWVDVRECEKVSDKP